MLNIGKPDPDQTVDLVELFGLTPAADLYAAQLEQVRSQARESAQSAAAAEEAADRAMAAVQRSRKLAAEMAEGQRKQEETARITLACTAVVAACVMAQTVLAVMYWM